MFKMMPRLLALLLLFCTSAGLTAQPDGRNNYLNATDSDPAATRLVNELRTKYEAYTSIQADFRLVIDIPGTEVETQEGTLSRQGEKFHFSLGNQEGISDGEAVYFIMHGSKEIQITNVPEPGETDGLLTPQSIFSFYDSGNYILQLQGEESHNGRSLDVIELKPADRDNSDFTKMRMLVDKRHKEVVTVLAFGRDGSRFTFHLDDTTVNGSIPASHFSYNKADYDGYYESDLRF